MTKLRAELVVNKLWDKHRAFADRVQAQYAGTEFHDYSQRVSFCSQVLYSTTDNMTYNVAIQTHNDYDLEKIGFNQGSRMARVLEIPLNAIRRPLYRQNDPQKVEQLMASIAAEGLHEPIDVLEVDGQYYGFSGCHRFEACTRLGHETIRAKVRRATPDVLRMHLA